METVTQAECIERNLRSASTVNDRIDGLESRVGRLEEQVNGDMGVIRTLQSMSATLQQVRDSLNKQSWLLPLATAIITAVVVGFFTK